MAWTRPARRDVHIVNEPKFRGSIVRRVLFTGIAILALVVPTVGASAGNGAPSGAHFNLNIIGVENPKKASMDDSNRHTIFVPLQGNCRINLAEGDFNVADGNCFDGDGAEFFLPDPDPDGDGVTAYSVYARALGKPGGSSVTVTCFDEAGETWCSTESVVLVRSTGKSTFKNVSKELLSLCLDTDGDLVCDTREFLFDRDLADYFWSYTNDGLRLAQLRFYEIPTNVGTTP
jgi:hypothetical protein